MGSSVSSLFCRSNSDTGEDNEPIKPTKESDDPSKYFISKKSVDILIVSWKDVEAVGVTKVGALAFGTLFERVPETFTLFSFSHDPDWATSSHYKHHCKVFVNVIGNAINSLHKPDLLRHRLGFLGYMHKMRDTSQEQFDILHEIFLEALEKSLKDKWSPQHREAWSELYNAMVDEMMK